MTSRVFITQQASGHDYAKAEDFGLIVPIWAPGQQAYGDTSHIADMARTTLATFDADNDYLLTIGDPALTAIAISRVALNTDGRFRLLKWDKYIASPRGGYDRGYRVVEIDFDAQPR